MHRLVVFFFLEAPDPIENVYDIVSSEPGNIDSFGILRRYGRVRALGFVSCTVRLMSRVISVLFSPLARVP